MPPLTLEIPKSPTDPNTPNVPASPADPHSPHILSSAFAPHGEPAVHFRIRSSYSRSSADSTRE